MRFIPLTILAFKGDDDDAMEKTPSVVDSEKIEYLFAHDLKKNIPIIGDNNTVRATSIMFSSNRNIVVVETPDEITSLIRK